MKIWNHSASERSDECLHKHVWKPGQRGHFSTRFHLSLLIQVAAEISSSSSLAARLRFNETDVISAVLFLFLAGELDEHVLSVCVLPRWLSRGSYLLV